MEGRLGASVRLIDFNDSILRHVFEYLDPLPDRFSIAATCKRFHAIVQDSRCWLRVAPQDDDRPATQEHPRLRHHFSTLAGAVRVSRPGHTILLLPGQHAVHEAPINITHVVRILGDGAAKISGDAGLEAIIQVQSTAQLCDLRLSSQRGACVKHSAGTLRVLRCVLQSEAMGLPHLISQLTTDACGLGDRLIVEETRMLGDCATPVRALGTGEVARARAIYLPHQTFAWFEVDAGQPGIKRKRLEVSPSTQPKWAGAFDPEQLQAALAWQSADGCSVVGRIDTTQEVVVR